MYICVYVCMYVCMHVCVYVCMHVCVCVRVHARCFSGYNAIDKDYTIERNGRHQDKNLTLLEIEMAQEGL